MCPLVVVKYTDTYIFRKISNSTENVLHAYQVAIGNLNIAGKSVSLLFRTFMVKYAVDNGEHSNMLELAKISRKPMLRRKP